MTLEELAAIVDARVGELREADRELHTRIEKVDHDIREEGGRLARKVVEVEEKVNYLNGWGTALVERVNSIDTCVAELIEHQAARDTEVKESPADDPYFRMECVRLAGGNVDVAKRIENYLTDGGLVAEYNRGFEAGHADGYRDAYGVFERTFPDAEVAG